MILQLQNNFSKHLSVISEIDSLILSVFFFILLKKRKNTYNNT